jgi:hypothetical protein
MSLVPKISLSLGNKCNLVNLIEETNPYEFTTNPGGWGGPNIDASSILYAGVNIFPFTYNPTTNAVSTGSISGNVFTDTTHLAGVFSIGQTLTGPGVLPGTIITALGTGTGTNNGGTYIVNILQSVGPTTITGTTVLASYTLKNSSIDVYAGQTGYPILNTFTALSDQTWNESDGIYQIIYTIEDIFENKYTNATTHELFICNICNCKDSLVVKLIDACDSITVKKLKEQVDQMEVFIYGIQSAFACGDFDTADNIITAATKYCQTVVNCGCGCGDC